jgi:hypothetical protein
MAERQLTESPAIPLPLAGRYIVDALLSFWALEEKVRVGQGECIEWTASLGGGGYGHLCYQDGMLLVHRLAWQALHGPIPAGMLVCHHCDNPRCVNPDHLFLGTHQDNMDDCGRKGRRRPSAGSGWRLLRPEQRLRGERIARAKLTPEKVKEIRRRYAAGETLSSLGREFGLSHQGIRSVVLRKTWGHVE